jgi:hypothetical protein
MSRALFTEPLRRGRPARRRPPPLPRTVPGRPLPPQGNFGGVVTELFPSTDAGVAQLLSEFPFKFELSFDSVTKELAISGEPDLTSIPLIKCGPGFRGGCCGAGSTLGPGQGGLGPRGGAARPLTLLGLCALPRPKNTGWARCSSASSRGCPSTPTCSSCGRFSAHTPRPPSSSPCPWCAGAGVLAGRRTRGPARDGVGGQRRAAPGMLRSERLRGLPWHAAAP